MSLMNKQGEKVQKSSHDLTFVLSLLNGVFEKHMVNKSCRELNRKDNEHSLLELLAKW